MLSSITDKHPHQFSPSLTDGVQTRPWWITVCPESTKTVTNATKLKVVPIYDKNTQPIHNLHIVFVFLYPSYSIALKTSR